MINISAIVSGHGRTFPHCVAQGSSDMVAADELTVSSSTFKMLANIADTEVSGETISSIGFTGNQVIDNLLNLATIYQKEENLPEIEKIARRILDYDDLNEEAIFLQIWALQKNNNLNLAKFNFTSFTKKYETSFGEPFSMNFAQFNQHFEKGFI
jgi:hypothetical protein